MTNRDRFAAILGGAVAGIFGGLLGIGGGIVIIPVLTGIFRLTQHQAHGTSLATVGATALASILIYGLHGRVEWRTALIAGLGSMLTAPLGARAATRVSTRQLQLAFALFLAIIGVRLLLNTTPAAVGLIHGTVATVLVEFVIGATVGLFAGFMGVGGGVLAVPAFMLLLGMPQHVAQGTSLALIVMTSPAGAWMHARHGNLVGRLVAWLSIGAALGGLLASTFAQRIPGELLTRAFAIFMLIFAVRTGLKPRFAGSPAPK